MALGFLLGICIIASLRRSSLSFAQAPTGARSSAKSLHCPWRKINIHQIRDASHLSPKTLCEALSSNYWIKGKMDDFFWNNPNMYSKVSESIFHCVETRISVYSQLVWVLPAVHPPHPRVFQLWVARPPFELKKKEFSVQKFAILYFQTNLTP